MVAAHTGAPAVLLGLLGLLYTHKGRPESLPTLLKIGPAEMWCCVMLWLAAARWTVSQVRLSVERFTVDDLWFPLPQSANSCVFACMTSRSLAGSPKPDGDAARNAFGYNSIDLRIQGE